MLYDTIRRHTGGASDPRARPFATLVPCWAGVFVREWIIRHECAHVLSYHAGRPF